MDERLFGKTILIGREPINNRLLVSLNHNGKNYLAQIGQQGCVPDCVSRCIPNENKAHCRLNIDPTGTMTIENVKAENITFVDGTQIMKKRVAESNVVEMGKYKHKVTVAEIINAATLIAAKVIPGQTNNVNGAAANAPVKEFDIRPLKEVYADYHQKQLDIRIRQRNLNLMRGIAPIFTIGSGALQRLTLGPEFTSLTGLLFFVGLGVAIWACYKGYNDKSIEETDQLTEEFQHKYVCPNPDCHHFLGMRPYHLLQQDNNCSYCKCKFKK